MYDHIGLKVKDLDASVRFYKAALAPLGHVPGSSDKTYAGIGPKGAPALWLYAAGKSAGSGTHIGFRAPDRAAVDRFHTAGLKTRLGQNSSFGRPGMTPALGGKIQPWLLFA